VESHGGHQLGRAATVTLAPRITDVERILLDVPFRDRCRPWNEILVDRFRLIEVVRVRTEDPDIVGYGESLCEPGLGGDGRDLIGRHPADHAFDDTCGFAVQVALLDVLGQALGVPVHRLFARPQVRDRAALAWWDTKMPAEVLAAEAGDAVGEGYLAHKIKARPFVDVVAQVEAVSKVTPEHYELDLDWNQMLLDVGTAAPVLQRLDGYQRASIYETPIRQRDLDGYARLRTKVAHPVVEHFLETPFPSAVAARAFDGFVVSGYGVTDLLRQGTLAAEFNQRCWIQIVGAGLATALVAHLAAVLPTASWPNVTCVNTYAEDLLVESLPLRDGYLTVPTAPGLGVQVDDDALDRLRVRSAAPPPPRRILTVSWPGDRRRHYADIHQLWRECLAGAIPAYAEGADLAIRHDDGSSDFAGLYARCRQSPVQDRGAA